MFRPLHKNSARRALALVLMGAALSFGVSGAAGFAGPSQACGIACPCEQPAPVRAEGSAGSASDPLVGCARADACGGVELADLALEGDRPPPDSSPDPCADVCQNCACCPGAVAATLVLPVEIAFSQITLRIAAIESARASVGRVGVFRPPRSRS